MIKPQKNILLSFDIEEFDMPFEYAYQIDFKEQMEVSIEGTKKILTLLENHQIKATFFSTAIFAINAPEIIQQLISQGHELASHTYHHSKFEVEDYLLSKQKLEDISGQDILGFRMPRMQTVDSKELFKVGYLYNSSINPTYLPGRYNNLNVKRTFFKQDNIIQIPASVTPLIRFPLFWLSFHNLPLMIYKYLCKLTLNKDKYLNIYFHPWEFIALKNKYNFPRYVTKNDNDYMLNRMDNLISFLKSKGHFITFKEFCESISSSAKD